MKNRVFNPPEAGGRKPGGIPKDARFNPFDGSSLLELRGIRRVSRRENQLEAFRTRRVDGEKLVSEIVRTWMGKKEKLPLLFAAMVIQPKEEREYTIEKCVEEIRKVAGEKDAAILRDLIFSDPQRIGGPIGNEYMPVDELDAGFAGENGLAGLPAPALLDKVLQRGSNENLIAQGVEIWKGGITSLINIMLEGEIRKGQVGSLSKGNPDVSSGRHGPYYVVVDVGFGWRNVEYGEDDRNCRITEDAHVTYIVPLEEHKAHVTNAIAQGFRLGLVSWHEAVILISKLATYEEFVSAPKDIFRNSRAFSELNKETAKERLFEEVDAQEREEYNRRILR